MATKKNPPYKGKLRYILKAKQHKETLRDRNGKVCGHTEYVTGDVLDSDVDLVEKIQGKFAYADEQGRELTHKRGVPVE